MCFEEAVSLEVSPLSFGVTLLSFPLAFAVIETRSSPNATPLLAISRKAHASSASSQTQCPSFVLVDILEMLLRARHPGAFHALETGGCHSLGGNTGYPILLSMGRDLR